MYILFAVYLIAINFYSVMLIRAQREESQSDENKMKAGDGRLILAAALGGAIAIYASMFAMRYRLKNMLLMIVMPLLAVLNIYLSFIIFKSGLRIFIL